MHSQLTHIAAQERVAELRRVADNQRSGSHMAPPRRQVGARPAKRISSLFARLASARA